MFDGWILGSLIIFAIVIVFVVIAIGAIGIFLTEHVPFSEALTRAIRTVFGGGHGPKNATFGTMYHPIAYLSMFFVTGVILTEVARRIIM